MEQAAKGKDKWPCFLVQLRLEWTNCREVIKWKNPAASRRDDTPFVAGLYLKLIC